MWKVSGFRVCDQAPHLFIQHHQLRPLLHIFLIITSWIWIFCCVFSVSTISQWTHHPSCPVWWVVCWCWAGWLEGRCWLVLEAGPPAPPASPLQPPPSPSTSRHWGCSLRRCHLLHRHSSLALLLSLYPQSHLVLKWDVVWLDYKIWVST